MLFLFTCSIFEPKMNSRVLHIKKGIVTSLFLLLLGGIIFNSTFYLHTHRTACGKVIVHAHPFNKGAEKQNPLTQHSHNKIDLQVISSLHYFIDFGHTIDLKQYAIQIDSLSIPSVESICSYFSSSISKRGPPSEPILI